MNQEIKWTPMLDVYPDLREEQEMTEFERDVLDQLKKLNDAVQVMSDLFARLTGPVPYRPAPALPIPPDPVPLPSWPQQTPPYVPPFTLGQQRCLKCSIALSPIMGYLCPQNDCPSGLGGVSCTAVAQQADSCATVAIPEMYKELKRSEDGFLLAQGYAENL